MVRSPKVNGREQDARGRQVLNCLSDLFLLGSGLDRNSNRLGVGQVNLVSRFQRLEKLGGTQDYSHTVLAALKAFDGTVGLTFLGQVLPDHSLLTAARKQLAEKGMIIEVQEKNRKILKLVSEA